MDAASTSITTSTNARAPPPMARVETVAPTMMMTKPAATSGVSSRRMPSPQGRIRPKASSTSPMPIKRTNSPGNGNFTASTATGVINFMPPAKRTCAANSPCTLSGSPVVRSLFGELLELSCVYVAHPFPAFLGRWADPRVADNLIVTQGLHVRPILVDSCTELIGSADGAVTWDEDIDVVRHALEQSQRGEVVPDRVS